MPLTDDRQRPRRIRTIPEALRAIGMEDEKFLSWELDSDSHGDVRFGVTTITPDGIFRVIKHLEPIASREP